MNQATAKAYANIAFIKYWGNSDDTLRIPVNSSISMNLHDLHTETTVIWQAENEKQNDTLYINDELATPQATQRVTSHLNLIRRTLGISNHAIVKSHNNFPMGAGIASSASAFAALTHAAVVAAGHELPEKQLTTLARQGSGSASRSIPAGFVIWHQGDSDETSYAESVATPEHWDLVDVIAIISAEHKTTGSQAGHPTAKTSDLQNARVEGAAKRLEIVVQSIEDKDFAPFAEIVEKDSDLMHAVMMTSNPPLFYWKPTTLTVMESVRQWRSEGLQVCYTLDAGPNVHCICLAKDAPEVRKRLQTISGVKDIRTATPGGASHIITNS
jgi:diphosphomevalonate decarboxylase